MEFDPRLAALNQEAILSLSGLKPCIPVALSLIQQTAHL